MTRSARDGTSKGFTLIELMIAISIIAILATIGIIMFQQARIAANNTKRKADLNDIRKALYSYRTTIGTFCLSGAGNCTATPWAGAVNDASCGWTGNGLATAFCGTAGALKNTLQPYVRGAVDDPVSANHYFINITADDAFILSATLEGVPTGRIVVGDNSGCNSPAPPGSRNYCISQ